MAIAYPQPRRSAPRPKGKIPDALIYEIMDGVAIYRKGYRDVLSGKKTSEEIRGASTLQSVVISHLVILISKFIDEDKYFVLTGESGIHLDRRNNLANDIAICDQTVLTPAKISKKYADVPPLIAIDVDSSADVAEMTKNGYLFRKTRKLFKRSGAPVWGKKGYLGAYRCPDCDHCHPRTHRIGRLEPECRTDGWSFI